MGIINPVNAGGVITSNTLNLTRITTMIAGALGGVAAGSGAVANINGPSDEDWAGFSDAQRLVIIVALIAAVAIVHAADLIARSLATSRVGSSGVIPLSTPQKAEFQHSADDRKFSGKILAIRGADPSLLFYDTTNDTTQWVSETAVTFK